jgi:hypothetical protein
MEHTYFETVDWNMARKKCGRHSCQFDLTAGLTTSCIVAVTREIVVPMIPDVEGEDDTSYFEEYDDEDEHVNRVYTPITFPNCHVPRLDRSPA